MRAGLGHALRLLAAGFLAAGTAVAAPVETAVCKRDRLVAPGLLQASRDRLLKADGKSLAVQCAAWRDHVQSARTVADTYRRCVSGAERDAMLAEMGETERGFSQQVASRCRAL